MRPGPSFWGYVKTTRHCPVRQDRKRPERPLTIDDVRNPLLPWLGVDEGPDDHDDIRYARCWVSSHPPVESLGSIQVGREYW